MIWSRKRKSRSVEEEKKGGARAESAASSETLHSIAYINLLRQSECACKGTKIAA